MTTEIEAGPKTLVAPPGQGVSAIVHTVLSQALDLLPRSMDSERARVLLLAIGLQESKLIHRRQLVGNPPRPVGPATGLWQFERGGGCAGVLTHEASKDLMRWVCRVRKVKPTPHDLWTALQTDDVLAAAAARLLLWTDPKTLPSVADAGAAWETYIRTWRPGKPHPATWSAHHAAAAATVTH
jgi:hypothetical protein